MERRRVLICGATGFVGRNLLQRLAARPDLTVRAQYHRTPPVETAGVEWVHADLTDAAQVNAAVAGAETVIHAAAVTSGAKDTFTRPYIHVTDNAVMGSLLFRACFEHGVRQVVYFSASTMYAPQDEPVREEAFDHQITEKYFGAAWTKVYLEKMAEFYARLGGARYAVLRVSNLYGPHDKYDPDKAHVFGATVRKVMDARDGRVVVWGDGRETRDLLYIDDLVDLVEAVLARQAEPFVLANAGRGQAISIRDLVAQVVAASGRDLAVEYDLTRPTLNFRLALDIRRAQALFGWTPRVELAEGIRRTLAWYRQQFPAA